MKAGLIYHTPHYRKLVEHTARQCYQSYDKLTDKSENFIRSIMAKGHLSIASTGNMVFGVAGFTTLEEFTNVAMDLMLMKEINNYIRWTTPDAKKNPDSKIGMIVSMNILTFLDIRDHINEYSTSSQLWSMMQTLVDRTPELRWFYDKTVELDPIENPYVAKGEPELYRPVLLTEDYTELKEKGLTDYELEVHATVTFNLKVDRATGLQIWRHADMTGGTELSQRYVDRSDAEYRRMVGFEKGVYPDFNKALESNFEMTDEEIRQEYDHLVGEVYQNIEDQIFLYNEYKNDLIALGVHQGRAKEIARAVLPNAMTTKIINCRPLRQWKHFIELRDSAHAQKEIAADTRAIVESMKEAGIEI